MDTTEQQLEHISGSVHRVTFHNPDNGFCVLRVKIEGRQEPVTIIGTAMTISAGEYIECQGVWFNDQKHGMQFKSEQIKSIQPTSLEGIEKYLGSGMIKGIGPHFAKKLVTAFGSDVFDVIENQPERVMKLPGMGTKRKKGLLAAWREQAAVRNIMVFLQSHGIGSARAVRIYKTYGDNAIERIQENPYQLALDVRGIGFKIADELAGKLGIAQDSMIRVQAGVRHVLQELCSFGHCAIEEQELTSESSRLLGVSESAVEIAIKREVDDEHLVRDDIAEQQCLYPVALYAAEVNAAKKLKQLIDGELPWGDIDLEDAIPWVEDKTGLELADSQRQAITTALQSKLTIITGGPGVGKTTIVNSLLKLIRAKKVDIALCAPTGRAAKRLTESTGLEAKTIHRLLDYDPASLAFRFDADEPLPIDVLVIDEASMLDITLFSQLLDAVPSDAAVIFVGDIDQLPSVGSGAVLADLIQSEMITTVSLTEVFRQAADSKIIQNAHRINQGEMPVAKPGRDSDFFTIYVNTPEELQQTLLDVVARRLPQHYACDPLQEIQVLTPMKRGGLGSNALNVALQQQLNGKAKPSVTRFGTTYSPGDKVIQMVNNYDREVFNGDIGFIEAIDAEGEVVSIRFEQDLIDYSVSELDEISLAYAISIHKSQGSEFPFVVIPLATQHYKLLARNLLYTGVTRGKELVVLIGQEQAISMAVRNNKESARLTKLAERLA